MLLTYFLNDFEIVPVAPVITGITLALTFHMLNVKARVMPVIIGANYYYYYLLFLIYCHYCCSLIIVTNSVSWGCTPVCEMECLSVYR
jgi:hypothetical protein